MSSSIHDSKQYHLDIQYPLMYSIHVISTDNTKPNIELVSVLIPE